MKKYVIACCIFINIFMLIFCAVLSSEFDRQLDEIQQNMHLKAVDENKLCLASAELFCKRMLEQYNTTPTVSQYNAFGEGRFTVMYSTELDCDLPQNNECISTYIEDTDEILSISELDNNRYLVTVMKCGLSEQKILLKERFITISIGAFAFWAVLWSAFGLVIFLHQRKLAKAMAQVADGNYQVRIKGEFSSEFNSMTESVSNNVVAANEAARAQRDFVSNFSHELKTPLTAIIGYADLLRSAELDSQDTFTAASYIFSEGKRLEALSLKLMDMIVLDNHEFPLRPLPASKLLQHIAITVRPMLSDNQLDLEFHAAAARIEGERDLLITLIVNLLDNARKASEDGGKIVLRGTVEGDRYKISIKDFGRGIPQEELSRITEAFYMVDKSRARAQHGAGLGLALCQKIAIMHGSGLEFNSTLGEGTEVSFTVKKLPKTKEVIEDVKKES